MTRTRNRSHTPRSKVNSKGTRMSVKRVLLLLLVILYADVGFSLTIATGPSDGTYIQIARDIQKVAQKDGSKWRSLRLKGPSKTWCCWEIGRWILRSPKSMLSGSSPR